MMTRSTDAAEFDALRPRLLAIVEQHRAARTDEERSRLVGRLEDVFLATAWNVAHDLLENGWTPGFFSDPAARTPGYLRLVGSLKIA